MGGELKHENRGAHTQIRVKTQPAVITMSMVQRCVECKS